VANGKLIAQEVIDLFRCPNNGNALRWSPDGALISDNGRFRYALRDGIACLTPQTSADADDPAQSVRDYYDAEGWTADEDCVLGDTRAYVDLRPSVYNYTHRSMVRLGKHFRRGGKYILDAGSGPIPHDAYLDYSAEYSQRICMDLSLTALRAAQSKLGDRGVYIQGDVTNIPLQSGSVDAVTCNHVMYHVPADKQATAFREIWRVLRPGGVAVVVNVWDWSPIAGRLEKLAKRLTRGAPDPQIPALYYHPHSLKWFQTQNWPFRYEIDTFRIVDDNFMKKYISDDWRGRIVLRAFYLAQVLFPGFCGRYGNYPAIVIRKD
jgi:ubiquinone/menaquinone biosynthesis C-methylase UbiE